MSTKSSAPEILFKIKGVVITYRNPHNRSFGNRKAFTYLFYLFICFSFLYLFMYLSFYSYFLYTDLLAIYLHRDLSSNMIASLSSEVFVNLHSLFKL